MEPLDKTVCKNYEKENQNCSLQNQKAIYVFWGGVNKNQTKKMAVDLIKVAEEAMQTSEPKQFPDFKAGDTVTVAYKIVEGTKERIQLYRGVVIKIAGHQEKKRFTVRKMSGTVGVERIFPLNSPNIDSIEVNKVGKVRRAKLYYLRNLTGKKARIKEKLSGKKNGEA